MPNLTIDGEKTVAVEPGTKLVLAIEDAGIDLLHRCGGNARCTTCRVEIVDGDPGPMNDAEKARLERETGLSPTIRLSCQIRVEGDLSVRVLNRSSTSGTPAGPRPMD
jgi:ferredoxin